jgi:tetratricopeptide (TPR) repeat protein
MPNRRKSHRIFLIGLLALVVLFATPPLALLAAPKRLRDHAYREMAYRVIANEATRDATDELQIVESLLAFVSEHETSLTGAAPIDATVLDDLVRGIGFCDQQSWGLSTLLAAKGIPAVMLMLRGHDEISRHSVTSVYVAGKWRIVDPLYDLVFFAQPKEPASFEDLARPDRRAALTGPKRAAIQRYDPAFLQRYFALFDPVHAPVRWHPDTKDAKRRVVSKVMNLYLRMGNGFAYRFQDAWLRGQSYETPEAELFLRARHYDLFSRRDLALAHYRRLIAEYPNSSHAEDGLYFMARLLSDQGRGSEAVEAYDLLLRRFGEQGKWAILAHHLKGRALEDEGLGSSESSGMCSRLQPSQWIRLCAY